MKEGRQSDELKLSTYIFDTLIDFFHEFEARLIGPGEERVSCHLLLIGLVDDVLDGLELDFVDLRKSC